MLTSFSFTRRYILALLIIALLAILTYINLNRLIGSQEDDGKWIYISDHQKLLTQQIALYAIYYQTKELHVKIQEFEKAHILLIANARSKELKNIYFESPYKLDSKIKDFIFHAKRFYEKKDGRSLTHILQNSKTLLGDLDTVVNIYLSNSIKNTNSLKRFELYILMSILLTLVFEALFIFMPANRSIIKQREELIAEKDYSNAVIESSSDAIIAIDKNSTIRTFNKEAQKVFGFNPAILESANLLFSIFPSNYKKKYKNNILSLVEDSEHQSGSIELELKRGNGISFPAKITFAKSKENKDLKMVIHIKDISKEKLKDKIVLQQAKFAALGEMIAIIAHQWRQPLAQLNFNYMYIKNQIKNEALREEFLKNEEIVLFMSETITSFEQFYKKTNDSRFSPTEAMRQALNIIQFSFKSKHIKVLKNIESKKDLYGNKNSLSQVFLSILQNIADIVKIRKIIDAIVKIDIKDTENGVIIVIEDNAKGIMIDPIDDIFKPFISKKPTSSTGVGLYMSRLIIVDKFQGSIKAQNTDIGAKFTIMLPC